MFDTPLNIQDRGAEDTDMKDKERDPDQAHKRSVEKHEEEASESRDNSIE